MTYAPSLATRRWAKEIEATMNFANIIVLEWDWGRLGSRSNFAMSLLPLAWSRNTDVADVTDVPDVKLVIEIVIE